jgi:SAM-dependent methyltransferase
MNEYYETRYGRNPAPARIKAVAKLLTSRIGENSRWLDIGCGNMDASTAIIDEMRRRGFQGNAKITGWDVSHAAVDIARQRGFEANVKDISAMEIPSEETGLYDVILYLEVIEHLVDTDAAMRNIYKLLKPTGYVVVSTPNLAAWYNRILLALGFQPHGTEVSNERYRFGCQFVGRLLGETPGVTDSAAGHLRVFTWRALREFMAFHGFEVIAQAGASNLGGDVISKFASRFMVSASGNIVFLARRR